MKNIKKMGAVFLSSVIISGFSSLFVSAEDFNNDLGGQLQFDRGAGILSEKS